MHEQPRIGISGYGFIGRRHAQVAAEAGIDRVIFDPALSESMRTQERGAAQFVNSFQALLDSELSGLIVAGPDAVHAQQVVASCGREIPVLVEKPIADGLLGAADISRASREARVPVLAGYVLRHSKALQAARRHLAYGDLGKPIGFHVNLGAYTTLELADNRFAQPHPEQLFLDYSHEWDYLLWLFGDPRRGIASSRTVEGLELTASPNVVDGMIELGDGVLGTFHLDYVQRPSRRHLTVVGTTATLEVDLREGELTLSHRREDFRRHYDHTESAEDMFRAQLAHFLDVLAGRAEPLVGVEDATRALSVALSLAQSAKTDTWIDLGGVLPD